MTRFIGHGCNLRPALVYARSRGCTIRQPRRTGELVISHSACPRERIRLNARRKDAPRALTAFLLELTVLTDDADRIPTCRSY
jgi:hypothetical protein